MVLHRPVETAGVCGKLARPGLRIDLHPDSAKTLDTPCIIESGENRSAASCLALQSHPKTTIEIRFSMHSSKRPFKHRNIYQMVYTKLHAICFEEDKYIRGGGGYPAPANLPPSLFRKRNPSTSSMLDGNQRTAT